MPGLGPLGPVSVGIPPFTLQSAVYPTRCAGILDYGGFSPGSLLDRIRPPAATGPPPLGWSFRSGDRALKFVPTPVPSSERLGVDGRDRVSLKVPSLPSLPNRNVPNPLYREPFRQTDRTPRGEDVTGPDGRQVRRDRRRSDVRVWERTWRRGKRVRPVLEIFHPITTTVETQRGVRLRPTPRPKPRDENGSYVRDRRQRKPPGKDCGRGHTRTLPGQLRVFSSTDVEG